MLKSFEIFYAAAAERCSYNANHMCDTEHAFTSEKSRKRDLVRNEHDLNIGTVGSYTSYGNVGDGCFYAKVTMNSICECGGISQESNNL